MQFLSLEFAGSFVLFLVLYWGFRSSTSIQNVLVLVASYLILISLHPYFGVVIGSYTLALYVCSLLILHGRERSQTGLMLAVVLAIGNLVVFKYFDFFRESINMVLVAGGAGTLIPAFNIMVPLGISFYTFHSVSYLVSLQNKTIEAASFLDFALFLAFFPSVMAGPINRAEHFLPQIRTQQPRSLSQFPKALLLITFGVIKIVWLGAFFATTWANPVFSNPAEFHALDALLGLLAYTWEIYFNFSGYTNLVTGLALLMGFQLPENFRAPYTATNLRHFWQRWHISLSSWIRDYLYIPLGGSRHGFTRTQLNVMISMLLSGLWHGASLNFLVWGAIHGFGMVMLSLGDRLVGRDALKERAAVLASTFTFLYVAFAWIFFRSPTLDASLEFITVLFTGFSAPLQFNSPLYLVLMGLLFRAYPRISWCAGQLIAHSSRLHWSLLPVVTTILAWLAVSLSPAGIPGFIYASF